MALKKTGKKKTYELMVDDHFKIAGIMYRIHRINPIPGDKIHVNAHPFFEEQLYYNSLILLCPSHQEFVIYNH